MKHFEETKSLSSNRKNSSKNNFDIQDHDDIEIISELGPGSIEDPLK